jgi:prepilin-type N-terminal cleavage/methylation domain-containing protein
MLHSIKKDRKSAFTLVEILVVIAILAILAVVTFVIINPVQRINQANDTTAREDVRNLISAIQLYSFDNANAVPTYDPGSAPGTALPVVTAANIMTTGIDAQLLEGISPTYMTTIPAGYRVGVLASDAVIIGATLSDASVFTITQ